MTIISDSKESFLSGGGAVGAFIRSKNWIQTPLGSPQTWPQSLKICVRIMLSSNQPMFIWWGKELLTLYNDAYHAAIGDQEYSSLGLPASKIWSEKWAEIAAPLQKSLSNENYTQAQLLLTKSRGLLQEESFTFSYNTIPGDDGETAGIIATNTTILQKNQSENQLQNLFLQAPVAISVFKGEKYIIEIANEKMIRILGKNLEDILNKPLFESFPEAVDQGYEKLLNEVYKTGQAFVAEEMPLTLVKNGKKENVIVKFVFEPLYDDNGKISGIITLADEVTERVRARKKIENSELRYKLAIDAANIGSFELNILESKFLHTERMAEIFGFDKNTPVNHSDFISRIHPDDAPIRNEAHQLANKTGILFYEARFILPDDSIQWIRLNGKMIKENGVNSKMYGTALDITDHKIHAFVLEEKVAERTRNLVRKNEELKKSEERFQRMTEEVQDYAILLLDKSGTILNWNKGAEKIKGYKESEIIGKSITLFYRPEDQKSKLPQQLIKEAFETGRASHEGYRVRKDGTFFWGSVTLTALHDKNNEVIGFSKVTRDLTERKNAEDNLYKYAAELEFQNKELEQFAYVASHDLQEPLRKIQMFTDLLQKNYTDPEIANRYFGKIYSSAQRMSDLIKAVLNYSRLSDGHAFEVADLNQILQNVLLDFELLIEEKQAIISTDALPSIKVIPLQISQLFSNLIGNALKFSDGIPQIEIKAQMVDSNKHQNGVQLQSDTTYLELIFTDHGIGFDQQYADKVFTIFQRLHDRSSYSGTGIGLALCKRIIENHSGFISVKSEKGVGTSFYIFLPILRTDNQSQD